jgi:hypothetical protein
MHALLLQISGFLGVAHYGNDVGSWHFGQQGFDGGLAEVASGASDCEHRTED